MIALVYHETVPIPATHLDQLTRPICGMLTTMGADGQPQSSVVWVDHDGDCARVNTTLEWQKGRNMLANPKVSLLVVDPDDTGRYIQIQGDAELVTEGELDHLDELTRTYTRHPHYYGYIYPVEQRSRETRVICWIHARRSPSTRSTVTGEVRMDLMQLAGSRAPPNSNATSRPSRQRWTETSSSRSTRGWAGMRCGSCTSTS